MSQDKKAETSKSFSEAFINRHCSAPEFDYSRIGRAQYHPYRSRGGWSNMLRFALEVCH